MRTKALSALLGTLELAERVRVRATALPSSLGEDSRSWELPPKSHPKTKTAARAREKKGSTEDLLTDKGFERVEEKQ